MPDFNTAAQSEVFLESVKGNIMLANNDLSRQRILGILCSLEAIMVGEMIEDDPENAEGLALAQANLHSAHTYFSSIDEPSYENPE